MSLDGADPAATRLLALVEAKSAAADTVIVPQTSSLFEEIGRASSQQFENYSDFFAFVGETATTAARALIKPTRIRWQRIVLELQLAGVNALPIVGLLAFLLGIVIAYQGGTVLQDYGANIFIVDIVGLSMVRELAPLITAIIVAGRTGSAYTAQIGTMLVTEEIDALRSIGISPQELLVLPKIIALVIALPLLTVYADVMGLIGGIVMSSSLLGLSAASFVNRLGEAVSMASFLTGVGKAPVFADDHRAGRLFSGFSSVRQRRGRRPPNDDQRRAVDFPRDRHRRGLFDRVQSPGDLRVMLVSARGVEMQFGDKRVLDGVDLDVQRGEILAIVGGSGSGKSTLLRLLSMLTQPTAGTIEVFGTDVTHIDDDAKLSAAQTRRHDVSERRIVRRHERIGERQRAAA